MSVLHGVSRLVVSWSVRLVVVLVTGQVIAICESYLYAKYLYVNIFL